MRVVSGDSSCGLSESRRQSGRRRGARIRTTTEHLVIIFVACDTGQNAEFQDLDSNCYTLMASHWENSPKHMDGLALLNTYLNIHSIQALSTIVALTDSVHRPAKSDRKADIASNNM